METERRRKVQERAYHLWVESGHRHGQSEQHWLQAEREIEAAGGSATEADTAAALAQKAPTQKAPAQKAPAAKPAVAKPAAAKQKAGATATEAAAKPAPAGGKSLDAAKGAAKAAATSGMTRSAPRPRSGPAESSAAKP